MDKKTETLDAKILRFIEAHGKLPAKMDDFQALALEIFQFQFQKNPHYQKFCRIQNKLPSSVKNWKDIPAMPTDGFKELVLATFPIKDAVKIFRTSGTTSENKGAHFFDTLKLYETAIFPPFAKYLLPDSANLLYCFLIHSPKEAPDSSLSYMMGAVNRVFARERGRFYIRKNQILHTRLLSDLKTAKKKVFVLATAFSLKSFLDYLKVEKIVLKLPKGSRLMETGGFKGGASQISQKTLYNECEKRLGISKDHCVSEYGMTELSSQFYDTTLYDRTNGFRRSSFKAGPSWLKTLVIDPKTGRETRRGQAGLLRHFDLANRGSVMAIQTDDLGRRVGEGFELLGRASSAEIRGCSLSYESFLRNQSSIKNER